MKVRIDHDELWPYHIISNVEDGWGDIHEVDDGLVARYEAAATELQRAGTELEKAIGYGRYGRYERD